MAFMPKRYVIAVLAFIGTTLISQLRRGLLYDAFIHPGYDISNSELTDAEFAHDVGWAFSCLAGALATRYGGATTFGISTALSATVSLLSPFAFRISFWLYLLARFQDGFFQALAFCTLSDIWARWSPPKERSTLVTLSFCGIFISPVTTDILLPNIKFYLVGFLLIIWSVVWLLTVKNDPLDDKFLSDAEKQYLTENVEIIGLQRDTLSTYPWKSIITSKPVWILSIAFFILQLTTLIFPYFPESSRNVNGSWAIEKFFQLLPAFCFLLFGYVADFVTKRKYCTSTQIHKSYVCIGFTIYAVLQEDVVFTQVTADRTMFESLLESLRALIEAALLVNAIDLSPAYASLLYGISKSVEVVGFFFIHNIVFRFVYYVQYGEIIILFCFPLLHESTAWLYYRWGSAEVQSWNTRRREEHELRHGDSEAQAVML